MIERAAGRGIGGSATDPLGPDLVRSLILPGRSRPPSIRGKKPPWARRGDRLVRWKELSAKEMTLLDHVFWSSGISREALAMSSAFSKSRANAAVAGMLEQGVLEQTGEQVTTGGRR